jgi:peptide-methionine (S)-S-oxide reductase
MHSSHNSNQRQFLGWFRSRPYGSARPGSVLPDGVKGSGDNMPGSLMSHYDWSIAHCVLRGDNTPIRL